MLERFGVTLPGWGWNDPNVCQGDICNVDNDALETGAGNIVGTIAWVIGALAVIFIIVGGIMLATSNGDPNKVKKGKQTVIGAAIGLAVAVLTAFILNFVLGVAESTITAP
jgi:hypothetical protein